jgi:hypothetical protein
MKLKKKSLKMTKKTPESTWVNLLNLDHDIRIIQ